MNCPKCGNPINPNMKFCAKCGNPVVIQPKPVAPQQPMPQKPAAPQQPMPQKPAAPQQPMQQRPVAPHQPMPQKPAVPQQPMPQRPVAPEQPAQPLQPNNAVQPQPAKKKRKKKKNLGLIITAVVLVVAVLSMGGIYLADVLLYKNEAKKEGYITDFPILKQKAQLLVIDDQKFPVDEYEIKVEEHKFGGILKSDAFGRTKEVFTNKSSNPVYDITFPHDGNYRITLTGIVSSRINEAEDKTEEKAETIVIIIEVKVDNDDEKAIDKAAITSKEGDGPVEFPEHTVGNKQEGSDYGPYKEILDMYYDGISCNWNNCDSKNWTVVTDPDNPSTMFRSMFKNYSLSQIGYCLIDINNDGSDELIISTFEVANTGLMYNLYTVHNGQVVNVLDSDQRYGSKLATDFSVYSYGSGTGMSSYKDYGYLDSATGKINVTEAVIYDGWIDQQNPWFYADENYIDETSGEIDESKLKSITETEANAIVERFPKEQTLDLIPFSEYNETEVKNKPSVSIPADAVEINGHYYKLYTNAVCSTWEEAVEYCENQGGYIAVISSQEENDAVFEYVRSMNVEIAYFGCSDAKQEGVWEWANGENSSYSNWHSGEPNGGTWENYAEFYYKFNDGTWNDGDFQNGTTASDAKNFICEWEKPAA